MEAIVVKVDDTINMNTDDILELVEHDLSGAKPYHDDQIEIISDWMDEYAGSLYGNEIKGKSSLVWKLIKKQGESLIANIIKPFMGNFDIANIDPITEADVYKAKINEKLINHFWNKDQNPIKLLKTLGRVMVEEGTVFIRVGWEYKYTEKKKTMPIDSITDEIRQYFEQKGAEFEEEVDGTVTIVVKTILSNKPTIKVVRNEDIYVDPTADTFAESKFLIYEMTTSLSDISANPIYGKDAVKRLKSIVKENDDKKNYAYDLHDYNDYDFEFMDEPRKKIKLYEYWGEYDIDNSGVAVPIVTTIAEYGEDKDRVVLRLEKNPYPFKKIPFVCIPLYEDPFKIYGRSLSDIISDEQKVITAITRAIIDNISTSNNGMKFFKKGALDATNFNRLKRGDKFIEINTNDSINTAVMDGNFNQIPQYIINLIGLFESSAESLTGVTKAMQGLPGSEIKSSTSNFSAMMTQSQIRLLDITTNVTIGLKEIFNMWLSMSTKYINSAEVKRITGIDVPVLMQQETQRLAQQFGIQQLPEDVAQKALMMIAQEVSDMFDRKDLKYDIKMKVGTDGLKQIKIQNILMLMQQIGGLTQNGAVPPEAIKLLVADLSDQLDRPDIAQMISEYQPQPDPMAQQAQQLQMAQMEANVQKDKALAANAMARTQNVGAKTQKDIAMMDADMANKYADVNKKMADVDQKDAELGIKAHEAGTKRVQAQNKPRGE